MKRKKILVGIILAIIVVAIIICIIVNVNKKKSNDEQNGIYYPQGASQYSGNEKIGDANVIYVVE